LVALLAVLATLALGSTASAQLVVGQTAPPGPVAELCDFEDAYDEAQTAVAAGNSYVVPTAGVLTSWSTNIGPAPGQILGLKVFRPLGGNAYLIAAQDAPRALAPGLLNTFPISVPVLAGDIVGLTVPAGAKSDCHFLTGLEADKIHYAEGNAPAGATVQFEGPDSNARLNVSATLLPPPVISSLSPAQGSIVGGGKVVIAGANFASVQAVSFGATPAQSFTVDSEGQITATAPASGTLAPVGVTVTTVAGLAAAPTTFAYEGCRVPKLKGKRLKPIKKQAKRAACKIGKVKKLGDATAKTGEVVKQNPKPGKILAPGTKIKVTLDA
jgi:hypothetical protein